MTERRKKKINLGLYFMLPAHQNGNLSSELPKQSLTDTSEPNQQPRKSENRSPSSFNNSEQNQQPLKTGKYRLGSNKSLTSLSSSLIAEQRQQPLKNGFRSGYEESPSSQSQRTLSEKSLQTFKTGSRPETSSIISKQKEHPLKDGQTLDQTEKDPENKEPMPSQSTGFISKQKQNPLQNVDRPKYEQSPSSFTSKQKQQPTKGENNSCNKPSTEDDIDCTEAILATAFISTASTILLTSVVAILTNYFYPEQIDQFGNQMVMALDGMKQIFSNALN